MVHGNTFHFHQPRRTAHGSADNYKRKFGWQASGKDTPHQCSIRWVTQIDRCPFQVGQSSGGTLQKSRDIVYKPLRLFRDVIRMHHLSPAVDACRS